MLELVLAHLYLYFRLLGTLLTVYIPTILLVIIAHMTNYFKPFFFEAVVSVNLTVMLVSNYWFERSACAALGRCCGTKCQLYLVLFLIFLFFCATYFSPRRGCPRVMKVLSQNKNKIWGTKIIQEPPSTLGGPFLVFFFSCA